MRIAIVLLAVVALCALTYRVWLGAQSDEDLIRWRIDDAVEAFNDTRLSPCLELMTPGFVEESSGFVRGDIKQALVGVFFREVDPGTGEFLLQLAVDDVAVTVEERTARASFTLHLSQRVGEEFDEAWVFEVEGDLENDEAGWRFVRAKLRTLEGAIPR